MLQRITLLFFVMLLAVSPLWVFAQQPQPADTVASSAAAPLAALSAAPDTAAALHRLFALRRDKSHTALKVGGTLLVVGSIAVVTTAHGSGYQDLGIYVSGLLSIAGSVPLLATGIIRSVTYSKKHEQRIVQAWQKHRLSNYLKRALEDDSLLNAQTRLAQAAAFAALGPAAATPAAIDTAAALHRLFAAKRRLLRVMLPLTTVVGAGYAVRIATSAASYGSAGTAAIGATTLLALAGEVAILKRYSKKNEALALLALKEHRLPATQLRELKVEYFRPSKAIP